MAREYRAIFDWFTSLASSANAPNIHAHEQDKVARSRSLLGESAPIQLDNTVRDGFCGSMKMGEQRIAIGFRWLSTSFTALINSADHRASAPLHSCIDYPDSTAQLTAAQLIAA